MAASAYKRFDGKKIGELNQEHYVYTTNTLASTLVANFYDTDLSKFHAGDIVFTVKVDDLTKANLANWTISDASVFVVYSVTTHVDLGTFTSTGAASTNAT